MRLLDAETRYLELEKLTLTVVKKLALAVVKKLALAVVIVSRKLRPYFHVHTIKVLMNYPLRQVLQKPKASGRLLKWAIELGQFDMNYRPQIVIKGQALADFILEFTYFNTTKIVGTTSNTEAVKEIEMEKGKASVIKQGNSDLDIEKWIFYVDGASNENRSGVGIMLIIPEGYKIHYIGVEVGNGIMSWQFEGVR